MGLVPDVGCIMHHSQTAHIAGITDNVLEDVLYKF